MDTQGVKRLKLLNSKAVVILLVFLILFHAGADGILGSERVGASGFWEEHRGSIYTVIKGMVMLWIINLMRQNLGGNEDEDILTSTIKKGLNIGSDSSEESEQDNANDNINLQDNDASVNINSPANNNAIINYEYLSDEEFEMLKLINEARQEEGLNLLEFDMELTRIARRKALDMIENNYFDHNSPTLGTPFEMIKSYEVEYSLAGENLAESSSIKEAFQSLMASQEHRENITKSRYDIVGNGIVKKGNGQFVIVQLFIDSPDPTK